MVTDWLGKVVSKLAKTGEAPTSPSLAHPWLARLSTVLDAIDKREGARRGLARDIVAYVRGGAPVSVPGEIVRWGKFPEFLGIAGYVVNDKKGEKFYEGFEHIPPDARLRWAMLLEAGFASRSHSWNLTFPGDAHWLETLLMHAGAGRWYVSQPAPNGIVGLSYPGLLAMCDAAGLEASALLTATFVRPAEHAWSFESYSRMLASLQGFAESVTQHREALRPLLTLPAVSHRVHAATLLARLPSPALADFSAEIAELATSSSKQVRAAAEPLARACADAVLPHLQRSAKEGKPDQRVSSLRLIWQLSADPAMAALRTFAIDTARADKAPSVQALPDEWASADTHANADLPQYAVEVPEIDWSQSASPALIAPLTEMWAEINQSVRKTNEQARKWYEQAIARGEKPHAAQAHPGYPDSALQSLIRFLDAGAPTTQVRIGDKLDRNWHFVGPSLQRLAKHPAMTPEALVKTLSFFGLLHDRSLSHVAIVAFNAMQSAQRRPSLLALSQLLDQMGLQGRNEILTAYCKAWATPLARDWPDDATWMFFAHHVDRLIALLGPTTEKNYGFDRMGLFRAVATLPTPPEQVVNALFDLALGSGKTERLPAQAALQHWPGRDVRIIHALSDGKAEVRAIAAQWLTRLACVEAVPALEKAVAREKHDVAKGAMLDALQSFGRPVENYLDRDALCAEATKSLGKGMPRDLDWFPWNALPAVRWQDSGAFVPPDVLRWLIVQAMKQKSPEPNAVLRKYCAMMAVRDREAFGQCVLDTWIAEDTRPISPDEALQRAKSQAAMVHGWMAQSPKYYKDDPNFGKSVEALTAHYLPGFLRQPAGSAVGSKGVLAVAAACAGENAAPSVARYLKTYYGTRAAQGKALIAMLAWIEHPAATQLMLSIGNRFRTRSFQEEATRQAEALAERRGWTLAELSDRTIPTAGFDEACELELSYGQRAFTARLLPDFKIELFHPDGRRMTALPDARQDDDATLAGDAKKAFAAAKKQIKSIVELQTDRLYEALCTGRDWAFEDWDRYLNHHPIVRRLVQRLVWQVVGADGQAETTFRPLDDGTLSDCEDAPVQPDPQARVRLAHDSNLTPDAVAAWRQHLVDYEIAPLFQQFGKGSYRLPDAKSRDSEILDFEGHLLEAFALRGRAGKLGYTRGETGDGGWFSTYEKRFPTLGLIAVVEFTGNVLPEQNRVVALLHLSFANAQTNHWERNALSLSQVPAVLLSECYNDMRLMAAEGTGFDPEWQKKSEY